MKKKIIPQTYTLLLSEADVLRLTIFYDDFKRPLPTVYHRFFATLEEFTVAVYHAKKGPSKVVFQGQHAHRDLPLWENKKKHIGHAGSDEVGTGDFFGPIVVVATYVPQSRVDELYALGVKDSKLLDDAFMQNIAPLIKEKIQSVSVVIHPEKYTSLIEQNHNMNHIKAMLHHHAIVRLKETMNYEEVTIIDQFATDASMQRYFSKLTRIDHLRWEEKAESTYVAVAASSILARVRFLDAMDVLNQTYGVTFPLGANPHVEQFGIAFAKHHGIETLKKVAKTNFSTFQRIVLNVS
jgi:ribonuclease HIII